MTNLLEVTLHVVAARKAMGRAAQHESPSVWKSRSRMLGVATQLCAFG